MRPDSTISDIIYYHGNRAVFYTKRNEVLLLDSAWVRYRDMSVYSDSIRYDVNSRTLSAYHQVRFRTASESIVGTMMHYNVDTRRGMMHLARTQVENGFFAAEDAWLVKERVLNARRASYTTCDHDPPHYSFYGPRVKLLMDDVAVAQPVLFRFGRVPLLAAPFWLVPVANRRKSGLMAFRAGNATDQGWYAKGISYYWVINDYSDATFYLDVMTRKGVQVRTEAQYVLIPDRDLATLQGSYIREWDTRRVRYSLNGVLRSLRLLRFAELTASGDFVSDQTYAPDYGEEPPEWLKQDATSHAELRRDFKGIGSMAGLVRQTTDFTRHSRRTELPALTFSFRQRPLPGNWTISPSASFSHRTEEYLDSTGAVDTARVRSLRAGTGLGIASPEYNLGPFGAASVSERLDLLGTQSYRNDSLTGRPRTITSDFNAGLEQRLIGTLTLSERINLRHADDLADTSAAAPDYSAAANGQVTLSRVYSVNALGIGDMLHEVRPGIGIEYSPKVEPLGLFGRPHITSPDVAKANFGLDNDLIAKVGPERQKRNLGQVGISSAFEMTTSQLAPLRVTANLRPIPLFGRTDSVRSPYTGEVYWSGSGAITTVPLGWSNDYSSVASLAIGYASPDTTRFLRGLRLTAGHTIGRSLNMVNTSLSVELPGWRLGLNTLGYNFVTRQLTDYNISVWRDLHCWEALANATSLGGAFRYDFEFRIKKLPDIKLSKSTFRPFLP